MDDINKSPVSNKRILSFNVTNKSEKKISNIGKNGFKLLFLPLKIQVVFGLGAPITLHDNITSLPSRTVEF